MVVSSYYNNECEIATLKVLKWFLKLVSQQKKSLTTRYKSEQMLLKSINVISQVRKRVQVRIIGLNCSGYLETE